MNIMAFHFQDENLNILKGSDLPKVMRDWD